MSGMGMDSEFHSLFQSSSESSTSVTSSSKSKSRSSERSRLRLRVHKNRSRYNYDQLLRHGFSSAASIRKALMMRGMIPEAPAAAAASVVPSSASASTTTASAGIVMPCPFLEVNHNASSFSVYAAIRQTVLEHKLRRESLMFAATVSASSPSATKPALAGIGEDSYEDEDENSERKSGTNSSLPKIVGQGLTVVFQLIRESRTSDPSLCCRALKALLDTLQGQLPESMRKEPAELMDSLFDLLLSLCINGNENNGPDEDSERDENSKNICTLSSACLLSLVVAIGETGKMLKAIASLITSPKCKRKNNEVQMETPSIITSMQKSVDRVLESSRSLSNVITFAMDDLCDGVLTENSESSVPLILLSSLRTLTKAHQLGFTVTEEDSVKVRSGCVREDFSTVCRFESHGGGWGYSGHSIEAVRFSADTDILCGGFGLFGGRGEYIAKLRLYDIGNEGGEQESEGELLAESGKIPFECPPRHKYPILFDEPVHLQSNRWYVAWAMISGPSSDCGSQGQQVVNAGSGEDQITFYFKSSSKSNNGTDVNAGQIPTILYKLLSPADIDSAAAAALISSNQEQQVTCSDPVIVLSRDFAFGVSSDVFSSLLLLLSWSWSRFQTIHRQMISAPNSARSIIMSELKHLAFISSISLHLLKVYVNEVFPSALVRGVKSSNSATVLTTGTSISCETSVIADCVADTRSLMKQMLTSSDLLQSVSEVGVRELINQILADCCDAFMSCYHAFYPSPSLRWKGLSDLLLANYSCKNEKLLVAVLSSLCSPFVKLTFPLSQTIELQPMHASVKAGKMPDLSPPQPIASLLPESAAEVILIKTMMEKESLTEDTDADESMQQHKSEPGSLRDIIFRLLAIIGQPIEVLMCHDDDDDDEDAAKGENSIGSELVDITCNLLTCILNELVSQSIGIGSEAMRPAGQAIYTTPCRFGRVLQNRTWNTGNGSPDAICFTVDRPGIFVTGVTLYGGSGNEWHYELELLEYQGSSSAFADAVPASGGSSGHQWFTIELTRGTYTMDESKGSDVCEVKFDRPVPVKGNNKYAIRLKNHGARTNNGDSGMSHVRGPDGTTFTFSDCLLSFNGTNHKRGQIPQILYFATPLGNEGVGSDGRTMDQIPSRRKFLKLYIPTRNVLSIGEAVFNLTHELLSQALDTRREGSASGKILKILSSSHLIHKLMPSVLSHLIPLASKDPKCAILIVSMMRRLLPLVSQVNRMTCQADAGEERDSPRPTTTSSHCVIVESDHPYKSGSVTHQRVQFSRKVKWMSLEFDPKCGTAQPEDSLQLYIPSINRQKYISNSSPSVPTSSSSPAASSSASPAATLSKADCDILSSIDYWPVCKRMTGRSGVANSMWPNRAIILPGNELIVSLETASDYLKDEKSSFYGFRVQVTGYESPIRDHAGFQVLEQELTYVGVTCLHNLLNKDLIVPSFAPAKQIPTSTCTSAQSSSNTITSSGDAAAAAADPVVSNPFRAVPRKSSLSMNQHQPPDPSGSLVELVNTVSGAAAASSSMSPWLQPESYVDPDHCEVECRSSLGADCYRCNWPVTIIITTRDQYNSLVHAAGLKIEVTSQPIHCSSSGDSDAAAAETDVKHEEVLLTTEDSNVKEQNANNLSIISSSSTPSPGPQFTIPYSITVKDKIRYHSISMMPAYEEYSHEELRFASMKHRSAEQLAIRDNRDGTMTATWIPMCPGFYQIMAMIDGEVLPGTQVIQVMDSHKGSSTAPPKSTTTASDTAAHSNNSTGSRNIFGNNSAVQSASPAAAAAAAPAPLPPLMSKTRKFIGKDSAGLRIRSLPSLQSAQIGLIGSGEVISFQEEMRNDDGIWVRLTPESIQKYCHRQQQVNHDMSNNDPEAWALQYNQHYWQSLLVPTGDPQSPPPLEEANELDMIDARYAVLVANGVRNGEDDMGAAVAEAAAVIQSSRHLMSREAAAAALRSCHREERRRRKKYRPDAAVIGGAAENGQEILMHYHPSPHADSTAYPCAFQVIRAGPSGHSIRSRPCVNSSAVGICMMGHVVAVSTESMTQEGTWLKLTEESKKRYCFNLEHDAWVQASNSNGKILFLQPQTEVIAAAQAQTNAAAGPTEETSHRSVRIRHDAHHTSPELLLSRRTFALQTLTWFLKNVTQDLCLHDILWSFVAGFTSITSRDSSSSRRSQFDSSVLHAIPITVFEEHHSKKKTKNDESEKKDNLTPGTSSPIFPSSSPSHRSSGIHHHHHPISSSFDRSSIILSSCRDHVADISIHAVSDVMTSFRSITRPAADCISTSFHSFLQAVCDLMPSLPPASPLLQIAVKCFHLKFDHEDHQFLYECGILDNISSILLRSKAEKQPNAGVVNITSVTSTTLTDVTGYFEVKTSSRQTMMSSLTDKSTETFWESGDEDRNKTKVITASMNQNSSSASVRVKAVYIHVDNGRDIGAKCGSLVVKCSESGSESFLKVRSQKVDPRFAGWIIALIPETLLVRHLKMEFKGPDNTLRLRHITILGSKGSAKDSDPAPKSPGCSVVQRIHRSNCEAETLRVFRCLTSQMLGKLVSDVNPDSCRVPGPSSIDPSLESLLAGNHVATVYRPHQHPASTASSSLVDGNSMTAIAGSNSSSSITVVSPFTHLQKQVCTHILRSLTGECDRIRQQWEASLTAASMSMTPAMTLHKSSSSDDAYCFEMISLMGSLCQSSICRSYLSKQDDLVINLLSLLHTSSIRIQKQVVHLLRQLLPHIEPQQLASLLGIHSLPVGEGSGSGTSRRGSWSDFDPFEASLLDILLSCVAKALTVQTKVKGISSSSSASVTVLPGSNTDSPCHRPSTGSSSIIAPQISSSSKNISSVTLASSIQSRDELRDRWFMRGACSQQIAEQVISLMKDMSTGKMGQTWSCGIRDSITENILNMTRLREEYRSPSECMRTPTLWLALASLCVMDEDQAERLSNWMPGGTSVGTGGSDSRHQRPFCENHDDGETPAIILCSECGNLCPDCDRFLHLHRRTKSHQRQIFKEEEEAIKVDLHEGCGRSKLFWLMSLADSRTLKAKVEFRGDNIQSRSKGQLVPVHQADDDAGHKMMMITGICRFCGATGASRGGGLLEIGNVCGESECQAHSLVACNKVHPCGHMCGGIKDEETCLPCLHSCDPLQASSLKQDADDMCMICFTDALSASPSIQLSCGHVFHRDCVMDVLSKKWPGPRITFAFSLCPICKADMDHPVLREILKPIKSLFNDVRRKAVMRLEYEGLDRSESITSATGRFHADPAGFAMERYAYYVCSKCNKAYFGGEARCDAEAASVAGEDGLDADFDPSELLCGACSDVSRAQMCPKHGTDFLEYKCRYCCSVAVFFCFGTTHFCNPCHDDFRRVTSIAKKDLPHCPAASRARQLSGSECPLHVDHPATGEEFALGCGVCRNAHTF